MAFRHATNLRVPLDRSDLGLLAVLPDYRLGAPMPATHEGALTLDDLRARGFVGLYVTAEALADPLVRRMTGWLEAEKMLGVERNNGTTA